VFDFWMPLLPLEFQINDLGYTLNLRVDFVRQGGMKLSRLYGTVYNIPIGTGTEPIKPAPVSRDAVYFFGFIDLTADNSNCTTLFDFSGDMPMISDAAPISTQNQGS
jgi:hypothetical protein